jgi:hypothetical protein
VAVGGCRDEGRPAKIDAKRPAAGVEQRATDKNCQIASNLNCRIASNAAIVSGWRGADSPCIIASNAAIQFAALLAIWQLGKVAI